MSESKKVALPAYLPRRLQAFRIVAGDTTTYLLRDKLTDKTHDLEPWQFFVLEVLPGCETVEKLLSVFEDRFGRPLSEGEVLKFFGWLADRRLLDEESAAHPLLKPFTKQSYALHLGLAKPRTFEELAALMAQTSTSIPTATPAPTEKTDQLVEEATLAAGVNEAENLDPRAAGRAWKLFEIKGFLARTLPLVAPLKWFVYLLPFLGLAALILGVRYSHLIAEDLSDLHRVTTLFTHALISLFAINILVVLTQAYVAQAFRASVGPLSIGLRFGFFPRFTVRVRHTEQLNRRERMWLHAGPLLMRVFLFSAGILVWYNTRDTFPLLALAGLSIGFLCAVNIVLEGGNPLVKGNGYFLLAAFMNEPHLRGKSYKAVMARLRGGTAPEADSNVLVAYALANFLYGFVVVAVIVMIVTKFLAHLQVGGTTVILACVLAGYLLVQTARRFSRISAAYERSVQFDRWRKRALPAEGGDIKQIDAPAKSRTSVYVRTAVALSLLLLMFLPYPYDAGGNFDIFPSDRQVITTDLGGIVEEVNFFGGESVKKGTVIARIAATDLKSEINVLTAKIAQQAAVVRDLQARPKKEEVIVAERALDVAKKREKFSRERVPRMERLYKDRAISFEEYDAARREWEVDVDEVAKRTADLALVKTGVTPDIIAAEKAKLDSLVEERATLNGKLERTTLRMPFDGNILSLHLNERLNSVMDKGQPFAAVENTRSVTAEIQVPESEIGYVAIGATIRAKPTAFFDREFIGKVQTIDRNVTVKPFGNVVKVIAVIDNPKGELKTGMTGYAKIGGTTMPVWKAFSLALLRFFNIQVWSWVP
jgi:putative peptide zinc metalloprotease protein